MNSFQYLLGRFIRFLTGAHHLEAADETQSAPVSNWRSEPGLCVSHAFPHFLVVFWTNESDNDDSAVAFGVTNGVFQIAYGNSVDSF